jgi:hypothetical protein
MCLYVGSEVWLVVEYSAYQIFDDSSGQGSSGTYSGRTSPILINLSQKLAQTKRLDAPMNMDVSLRWLRSLVGC